MSELDLQIPKREVEIVCAELQKALSVPGDVVEFGCYAGDTSIELARVMREYADDDRWLWLYDSFEGLPPKTAEDKSSLGWRFKAGELKVSAVSVAHKFKKYKLPDPVIKKGWFDQLDPDGDLPNQICFALLDGDYYASIKTSFALVAPKMSAGGIIMVHDYRNPALPGSARAVDEFIEANPAYSFRKAGTIAILQKH